MARMSSGSMQSSSVRYERVQLTLLEAIGYVSAGLMTPIEFFNQLPTAVTTEIDGICNSTFGSEFRSLSAAEQQTVLVDAFTGNPAALTFAEAAEKVMKDEMTPVALFDQLEPELKKVINEMCQVTQGKVFAKIPTGEQKQIVAMLISALSSQQH